MLTGVKGVANLLDKSNKGLKEKFTGDNNSQKKNDSKVSFDEIYNELVSRYGNRVQLKTCNRSIDFEKKAVYIPIASGDSISITPISTDMINICIGRTSTVCYCPSNTHNVKEMTKETLDELIKIIDSADSITNNHSPIVNEDNYSLNNLVIEEEKGNAVELNVEVVEKENK